MKNSLFSPFRFCAGVVIAGSLCGSAVAAVEYTQGNGFYYSGANSATVTTTTGQYASFTATQTTTATSLSINLNATDTTLTWGLQLDDGTGRPNGTFIAGAFGTTVVAGGWNTLNFPAVTLTEGQIYHVVLNSVATGANTAYWRLLNGATAPGTQPYGVVDPHFGRGSIKATGPDAPVTTGAVVYHIGTQGGGGIGQPYTSITSTNTISNPAQQFIFRAGETGTTLETITLRLTIAATRPSVDVTVALLDGSHSVLETVTLSRDDLILGSGNNYTLSLSGTTQLVDGGTYSLAVYGGSGSTVKWNMMQTSDEAYASSTFQGTGGYAFTYEDSTLTDIGTIDLRSDYIFTYTTIPEPGAVVLGLLGAGALILGRQRLRKTR